MKNKRCCSVKYILAKNVRSSGNRIIHSWISMLLTGICSATGGRGGAVGGLQRGPTEGVLLTEGVY